MVKRALLAVFLLTTSLAYGETRGQTEPLSVPAGTLLHCRNTQTLTTKLNVQGDAFTMSVVEPVAVDGHVAIPVGSTLAGRLTRIERPGRIKGVGQMRLTVDRLALPDGRSFPIAATLMTAYGAHNVRVADMEGLVKGPTSHFPDFEEIGAGTAGGVLLGLIFAHPVIGAGVGLAVTTVDRLRRRGKDLTIPFGTQLNYQLTRALAVTHEAPQSSAANSMHSAGD